MIRTLWKKISAKKLRQAADRLDPPVQPCPLPLSDGERRALEALADLGGITGAQSTFDRKSRIYSGMAGSFALPNEMDKSLRHKGLISGSGAVTPAGFAALDHALNLEIPAFLRRAAKPSPYREEVVS